MWVIEQIAFGLSRIVDFGKILGTSSLEGFMSMANPILGQSKSPLLIAKYLKFLVPSEILMILISALGAMSITIFAKYLPKALFGAFLMNIMNALVAGIMLLF